MRNELNYYLLLTAVCVGCLVASSTYSCLAQSPKTQTDKLKKFDRRPRASEADHAEREDVIRVETDLIINDILVLNKNGNPVKDLKLNDFTVKEDGRTQEISTFSFGDGSTFPRSIVLIIDYSGSQLPYIKTSIEAAKVLVDQLDPRDRMAIVTDNVELWQDFTTDKTLLKEKLESLKTSAWSGSLGQSRQYRALMAVLNEMFAEDDFRPIIIFQTDGDELYRLKGERLNRLLTLESPIDFGYDDILKAAERARATIYSIIPGIRFLGIPEKEYSERAALMRDNNEKAFSELRDQPFKPKKLTQSGKYLRPMADSYNRQQSALNRVARFTGGSTYYLEQPEQGGAIYAEILSDLKVRYLIGYYPSNQTRDGKRRNVSIELPGHPEYQIRARKSYILDDQ
jgi:VWFA-related protein